MADSLKAMFPLINDANRSLRSYWKPKQTNKGKLEPRGRETKKEKRMSNDNKEAEQPRRKRNKKEDNTQQMTLDNFF